jgi:predicted nucleic acid-binding Zn ribbon protein
MIGSIPSSAILSMSTLGTAPDKHCLFCGRLSSFTEDTLCSDDECFGDYINMCTFVVRKLSMTRKKGTPAVNTAPIR